MKFILDSSAIVKLFLKERGSSEVMELMKNGYLKNVTFFASELVKYEVGNAFWKKLRKKNEDGSKLMREYLNLSIDYLPLEDDLAIRIIQLAHNHDITYYDSVHVALSDKLDIPLVTDDKEILNTFDRAITITDALKHVEDLDTTPPPQ